VNFFELLFPDFSLILLGWLLCRHTPLDRSLWQRVESLVYYLLFPILLFQSILKTPLQIGPLTGLIGAAWMLSILMVVSSYILPRLPGIGAPMRTSEGLRGHAAAAQIGFRFNSFIALGISDRVAGPQGLALAAVLIGFCVPLYNVAAVWPMHRQMQRDSAGGVDGESSSFLRELLKNPLIIATVSATLLNLAGFRIPELLATPFTRLGNASLALGLMAAGAGLQLTALHSVKILAVAQLSIKHLLAPLAACALAWAAGLPPAQATALLLFAATPTSPNGYVLASKMGFDGAPVAAMITLSTVLGLFSLPFGLALASWLHP
jgi:predicted permease